MTESIVKSAPKATKKSTKAPSHEVEKAPGKDIHNLLDEVETLAHQFEHWLSLERGHWAKNQIIDRLNKIREAL